MGEYDDLMKAAKEKLEYQKKEEQNGSQMQTEDIYAGIREESEEGDAYQQNNQQGIPDINTDESYIDNSSKPEVDEEFKDKGLDDYYIDENDTPIFDGGPGISKLDIWKKQYGVTKVYHTKILDRHFIFRTLRRFEYEQIASMTLDAVGNEEIICKTCVLWPPKYDYDYMSKDSAGIPSTLSQIILENSGFTSEYGIEVL